MAPRFFRFSLRSFSDAAKAGWLFIAGAFWPAFWWLEYYTGLHRYLRTWYRCLLENERVVVFDLRQG